MAMVTPSLDSKNVLDILGASIGWPSQLTVNYRLKGTDTFTWGDQNRWIEIKHLVGLLSLREETFSEESTETHMIEYVVLLDTAERGRLSLQRMFVHQLEEIYSFRNVEAVRRFLHAHPHLIEVILEAYPYLVRHFGPNPQVMLEVVRDPEAERSEQLFAYILTSLNADEALDRLDRLDEEWFLDQFDRVGNLFNFNL
jgi:hypothetical protein